MRLVVIYGPPGVGKLTVASELAYLTGFKLYDNHRSIDAVMPVFTFNDPQFQPLVERVRAMVFEEAAKSDRDLVFTVVYSHPIDHDYMERLFAPVEANGGEILLVQLYCDPNVNEERFVAPSRHSTSKLTDLEHYRRIKEEHDLWTAYPGRPSFTIDNTYLSAEEAAMQIAGHFGLPIDG